ncbi:hypothetical protein INR49_004812, partial [Caranx melampygus]
MRNLIRNQTRKAKTGSNQSESGQQHLDQLQQKQQQQSVTDRGDRGHLSGRHGATTFTPSTVTARRRITAEPPYPSDTSSSTQLNHMRGTNTEDVKMSSAVSGRGQFGD